MRPFSFLITSLLFFTFACSAPATESDRDMDNIMDAADQCPDQPETVNNLDDMDGCPDLESVPDVAPVASPEVLETPVTPVGEAVVTPTSAPLTGS